MTPEQVAGYKHAGNSFRSRPGAPAAKADREGGTLGVAGPGGNSTETNWRTFFGEKGRFQQPALPVRPVPDVKNPMQTNPNATMGQTHPGWVEGARERTTFQDPLMNRLANGDLANTADQPTVLNDPDPSAVVSPPQVAPDLSTPEGLMAHANNTALQYFNRTGTQIAAPQAGQVQTGTSLASQYGTASVWNADDSMLTNL